MIVPEAALARSSKIIPQILNADALAYIPFDSIRPFVPDHLKDISDTPDYIGLAVRVVH
jgi:hypothetical protein